MAKYIILTFSTEREGKHYVARCEELGTSSFGESKEAAYQALLEATLLYLDTLDELGECAQFLQAKGIVVHDGHTASKDMPRCRRADIRSQVVSLDAVAAL